MKSLRIYIDPYNGNNSFYKNQKKLGAKSYSHFLDWANISILEWIDKLPSAAENEMNDNYNLIVTAPEFEANLIKLEMQGNTLCSSIIIEPYEISKSIIERLHVANELKDRYLPKYIPQVHNIVEKGEGDSICMQIYDEKKRIYILDDSKESIEFNSDKLIWHTPNKNNLSKIIHSRFDDVALLIDINNELYDEYDNMSDHDKDKFDALLLTEPIFCLPEEVTIPVGSSYDIDSGLFPSDIKCPELDINFDDNAPFEVSDHLITALDAGEGYFKISRVDNPEEPLAVFTVHSYVRIHVNSVDISVQSTFMECGGEQTFQAEVVPPDAEEAGELTVESGTPEFLQINNNKICAIAPGTGVIVARCADKSNSVPIEVRPKLEKIELALENKKFRVGDSIDARYVVTPANALLPNMDVESSDSSIVSIRRHEHYYRDQYTNSLSDIKSLNNEDHITLKAESIGKCEIILKEKDNGKVLYRYPIKVISTLYEERNKPSYSAFIAFVSALSCVIIVSEFPAVLPNSVLVALLVIALFFSFWSIFKKKRHYFMSILAIIIVIFLLVETVIVVSEHNRSTTQNIEPSETNIENTIGNGDRK